MFVTRTKDSPAKLNRFAAFSRSGRQKFTRSVLELSLVSEGELASYKSGCLRPFSMMMLANQKWLRIIIENKLLFSKEPKKKKRVSRGKGKPSESQFDAAANFND